MKKIILINLLICSGFAATTPSTKVVQKITDCLSAREYITTVNYFRKNKDFGLSEKEIQITADKVSMGCSGASQRFIKIVKVLTKMGIDTRSSIDNGFNFVNRNDDYTDVFIEIYKHTYDPKYLDLDALTAMKISLDLSTDYKGNVKKSLKDFKDLVEFCVKNKSMELPTPSCARVAAQVTRLGEDFKKPIAKPFIELIHFLQDKKKGPQLNRNVSMKIAQEVIKNGPTAVKNFKQGYLFAVSKKGLGRTIKQALPLATNLANRTIKTDTTKLKSVK
jgi:hypothetical protein